ncbi:MAG: SCO family protein [Pseudomonadota bacterium]
MSFRILMPSCLIVLAACSGADEASTAAGGAAASCKSRAYAEIGGPLSLINSNGQTVTESDFMGRPSLVYFGFTYCPDVCPASLVTIDQALDRLPEDVEEPLTILISIDPERDTPEAMADYISVDAFPEDIVGLTGSTEAVKAAADAFKTGYQKVEIPDSAAGYTMDHTSIVYLMDEDWSLKTFFTHETTSAQMADCLTEHLS